MNDDNQKIVWKKNTDTNNLGTQSNSVPTTQAPHSDIDTQPHQVFSRIPGIDIDELSKRSADYTEQQKTQNPSPDSEAINSLRAEIDTALGNTPEPTSSESKSNPSNDSFQKKMEELKTKANSSDADVLPEVTPDVPESESIVSEAEISSVPEPTPEKPKEKTDDELIADLKKDIQKNFEDEPTQSADSAVEYPKGLGVEQTYYSDLSGAMNANEPATMSELIKRARFEKKAEEIASPRSYKNILFIVGTLLFFISAIVLVSTLFKPKEKIEFVSREQVSSIINAERHTGINTNAADPTTLKQAIRKVIERKIPEDTINHIYYLGNTGRLTIKDIFDTTGNHVPEKLYDTIENDFMHGVYRTDKNYPFIILKALSYDRALEGMKEWEPYMIDDLAVYFDLPPEATDRSLIQDGFEDDLINNKTARVVRFLPREVDRRGILQFFGGDNDTATEKDTDSQEGILQGILGFFKNNVLHSAFAQNTRQVAGTITLSNGEADAFINIGVSGTAIGGQSDINGNFQIGVPDGNQTLVFSYVGCTNATRAIGGGDVTGINITLDCSNTLGPVVVTAKKNQDIGGVSFSTLNGGGNKVCYLNERCVNQYGIKVDNSQKGQTGITCSPFLLNGPDDPVFPGSLDGTPGYACFDALEGNDPIDQLSTIDPVCFNPVTGYRMSVEDQLAVGATPESPAGFCFPSYECHVYQCTRGGTVVSNSEQGQAGVVCGETDQKVSHNWTGADGKGQKICRQFTELLTLPTIDSDLLCFDQAGKYILGNSSQDAVGSISCINPLSREEQVCIDSDYNINPSAGLCLAPLENKMVADIQPNQCREFPESDLRSLAGSTGLQLRFIAGVSSLLGMKPDNVAKINNVANFLFEYAYGNILQNEAVRTGARIVQQLEQVLDTIDPNETLPQIGPNGGLNVYGYMRNLIYITRCSLGIGDSLQWETLGQLPQGFTIYPGQSISGVTQIQQALAIIGLMDPISITGTLDVLTQDAVSHFQLANGIVATGTLDPNTLLLLGTIQEQQNNFLNGEDAIIADYFIVTNEGVEAGSNVMALGAYSTEIRALQSILAAEGYQLLTQSGYFDPATCSALRAYQKDNNLRLADEQTCTVSVETLSSLNDLIDERGWIETNSQVTINETNGDGKVETNSQVSSVSIDDYFSLPNQINGANRDRSLSLGAYNQDVQSLQLLLYGEGYDIPIVNGLYDQATCDAVRAYQDDRNLELADIETCSVSPETVDSLNGTMRDSNYLGSGFKTLPSGESLGVGLFAGKSAPGSINFLGGAQDAEADSLKEGDIVLMYMFLDEHTILIARNQQVIDEVIRRRALTDIFND